MEFDEIFDKMKASAEYSESANILTVLLNSLTRGKSPVKDEDLAAIKVFVFGEIQKLTDLIPKTEDDKVKDGIFHYEDKLLGLTAFLASRKYDLTEEDLEAIKTLVNICTEAQPVETAVNDMFKLDKIEVSDTVKVLDIVKSLASEYQKCKFYYGLLHYSAKTDKMTDEAKDKIAEFMEAEFERYLANKDKLTEDEINSLEVAADVCIFFVSQKIVDLLKAMTQIKHNNIRYYLIKSLLFCEQNSLFLSENKIKAEVIAEMAADLVYADLTYNLLESHGQTHLFPQEFTNPEYLAKSDMIHWLTYPTELGRVPDAIELLGKTKVKGELYYVFKYKSASDTLSDDLKNEWLIGWSSTDGGTFSNFDKLSLFEQKKPEKTLKIIKKKLLG